MKRKLKLKEAREGKQRSVEKVFTFFLRWRYHIPHSSILLSPFSFLLDPGSCFFFVFFFAAFSFFFSAFFSGFWFLGGWVSEKMGTVR